MPLSTGIQHRLYLKQNELLKQDSFKEILPASLNYQNFIMVTSGIVEAEGQRVVFQTYSCGCGPQPQIRGAFLVQEVDWNKSEFRRLLGASSNPKDAALTEQEIFKKIWRIRPARSVDEKGLVEQVLRGRFGGDKKINFF